METDIVTIEPRPGFLAPVISVKDAKLAYQAKKDLIDAILKDNVDYGVIPGTGTKPCLLKAGAEKVTSFFGLHPVFKDAEVVNDWTGQDHGGEPFFFYRRTCDLYSGSVMVASVDGSCNSWEKKYRYRTQSRRCPRCGNETIIKGKEEYGGGWLCFAKRGGCGAKFAPGDAEIEGQVTGMVKNEDVADVANTILKMADKRALIAATLIATGLSEYFTQDMDDYVTAEIVETVAGKVITHQAPAAKPAAVKKSAAENISDLYATNFEPAPAPVDNGLRPYAPDKLYTRMLEQAVKIEAEIVNGDRGDATENDRLVLASGLEQIFTDKTQRYEFCKWLTGEASTKKISGPYVYAMKKWMKIGRFEDVTDDLAKVEGHAAHTQALKEAGQLEMPIAEPKKSNKQGEKK